MVCLEAKNVSIRYITGDFKEIGLKEYAMRRLKGDYHVQEFWADRNISFRLEEGEMLGIIGTNGAGKSTLLKTISGIMEPSEGVIHREGSIAALLELGSGFDGDLTVRENTYLRGAMMGYTRKFMDETYNQIIEFAELQAFQDRPFKQLSSGMKSRLAFSIASLVRPDILILDEVLAVGDGAFRKKSEAKMREIIESGATTILVSHSLVQIRELCSKVLWLHKGRQVAFGDNVKEICDQYQRFLNGGQKETDLPKFVAMQSLPLPAEPSGQEQANTKEQYQKHDGTDMKQNASMPSVPEEIMGQEDTLMQVKEKIPWKALTFIFLISVIFRGILASNIGEYAVFYDELAHSRIAYSIASGKGIFLRGTLYDFTEILYSLVISPAFLLAKNTEGAHQIILWMNAVMMSSAIYPIYMLAQKYLKKPLYIWMVTIYGILIGEMAYTYSVIQENLNYPLMMWFFFLFSEIVIDRECSSKGLCVLGASAFLLTTCKQMNLMIPIAVVLFFLIQSITCREKRGQIFKNMCLFSVVFLTSKFAYFLVMKIVLGNAVVTNSALTNLRILFDPAIVKQLVYPATVYLFFTFLATGIFPLIVLIANFRNMDVKTHKMFIFVLCDVFTAIATICILIVPNENLGNVEIRYHLRYYFYIFIVIAILFLMFCEKIETTHYHSRTALFLTSGYGILLAFMPIVPALGSSIDGISALYLRLLSENEVGVFTLRCILLGIIVLGSYYLYKYKYRAVCAMSVLVLIISIIGGTYFSSMYASSNLISRKGDKEDALLLNEYFKQENVKNRILLIEQDPVSDPWLECYLDIEYCYAVVKNFDIGKPIAMENLPLFVLHEEWYTRDVELPDYIISKIDLPIHGYEKVDTNMQNHYLLHRIGDEAWLEYKENDIWGDRWIGEKASLEIAGMAGRSDAVLTLEVDNIVLGETANIAYSDSSGFTGSFEIPPTSGERKTVEIPVHKPEDSVSYCVTFTPTQTKQPGTADKRYLAFRLWDAELQEKEKYKESGIWVDRWIGETASLELEGTVGNSEAMLTLNVDNILLDETAVVLYSDSSGFAGRFEIPATAGERETVRIPVHKPADSASYFVTFTPEQTKQPGTEDTRYLAFRLWSAELQESE